MLMLFNVFSMGYYIEQVISVKALSRENIKEVDGAQRAVNGG